jgi:hypothetical protein
VVETIVQDGERKMWANGKRKIWPNRESRI